MALPPPDYQGKVRDLYYIDESQMIICASDRVSAFDVVFHENIPDKGKILNQISSLWFLAIRKSGLPEQLKFSDQLITDNVSEFPEPFKQASELEERSVLVRRTKRIDFECVVRGYLTGSGYKDYQKTGSVCGIELPSDLVDASKLPEPIFTPATKAEIGEHDENVTFATMERAIGKELATRLREISLALYGFAAQRMQQAGIILCDTKFEFGLIGNEIVLIDEALTPDSSRYWKAEEYKEGKAPPGYDKQYIRDYAAQTGWNKKPPPPTLPTEVIQKTQALYREIESKIKGILK